MSDTAKTNGDGQTTQKTYHKRATGQAQATVKRHAREADLKLFGSCFCPFMQRIWIALEVKGIAYQYIEVDPYKKPESLLEVNPRGLVPAIRHGNWGCYESTVLLEYVRAIHSVVTRREKCLLIRCSAVGGPEYRPRAPASWRPTT